MAFALVLTNNDTRRLMKLIGLDFETANPCNGSICAVGAALLDNKVVVDKREWLIRPHSSMDWMLQRFTEIHGIGYYDLRSAPEFFEVWLMLEAFLLQGDMVIIHNAPFDLRHLRAVLQLYELPGIAFDYVCSLELSRKMFPEMASHSLDKMAARFGHSFQHHDALDDAIACAMIVSHTGIPEEFRKRFEYRALA